MTPPERAATRFVTDSGIAVPAVTTDEMRELAVLESPLVSFGRGEE